MSRNHSLSQFENVDNPWRRFPVVLIAALSLWGLMMWGVGVLLGHMAVQSHTLQPIDAQLVEIPAPIKHAAIPKPSIPRQIRQPAAQPSKQIRSIPQPVAPVSAPTAPTVSLPESRVQSDNSNKASAFTAGPAKKTSVSAVSLTPPQFGAAYLNNPKPVYPAFARRMGIEGTVLLKVLVSREGRPLKIDVGKSSGNDLLDKTAVEAVKKWRFIPARQGDSPFEESVNVPIAFHLDK